MTGLAWGMLALLVALVALAAGTGASVAGLGLFGLMLAVWVVAGLLVQRDARRLGMDDPAWAGSIVVVWGLVGLAWWFGYRRGASDTQAGRGE